jgi:chitin-binding protein
MKVRKSALTALGGAVGLLVVGTVSAVPAGAHGYVQAPDSRTYLCKTGENRDCGGLQYEPQSLEGLKGFPVGGPADGQIASAGGLFGGKLDEQSSTRWVKTDIAPGPMLFDWTYTAPHRTSKWHYYMTKQGWNQNAPLSRDSLELIGEVQHDGSAASTNPDHVITVPSNRSGYHVILAVWDVADTVNAFYNVIDVNVTGSAVVDTTPPAAPVSVIASATGPSSVALSWQASSDTGGGAVSYAVYRDGVRVATSDAPRFTDQGLRADTSYVYRVTAVDAAGNSSAPSAAVTVRTERAAEVDVTAPSAPLNLHSMGETASSIDLMWGASTDDVGVVGYRVYRDGQLVRSTSATRVMDTGLAAGTTYRYTVRAVDAAGNLSADSNVLTKATSAAPAPEPTPTPTPTPTPGAAGAWDSRATYAAGAVVTHQGVTYRAVQSHTGVGDPNWILARSLWEPVESATVTPEPTPTPSASTAWDSRATYAAGAVVTHQGVTYRAVQSHTGVGDPNWILAPSLWTRVN